jgi:hypothetical protein
MKRRVTTNERQMRVRPRATAQRAHVPRVDKLGEMTRHTRGLHTTLGSVLVERAAGVGDEQRDDLAAERSA